MATKRRQSGQRGAARKKRGNPAGGADAAFERFHGYPPEETVVITREVHFHKHLSAIGKLVKLEVVSRTGVMVSLKDFKNAILCQNEKGTQLFVEGGDQKVNVKDFGVKVEHEHETLGEVRAVEYFTNKTHLGKEGGRAIYRHKFTKPYPTLLYDTRNEHLGFAGGKYDIPPEGIDN